MTWDKTPKKPKNFRKRRASASSHTTDSSSTELCDSSSEDEEGKGSDSVWLDPAPSPLPTPTPETITVLKESLGTDLNTTTEVHRVTLEPPKIEISGRGQSFDETEAELLLLTEQNTTEESLEPSKCIDTNDSQHFLEEMSRLGKSDSFYENLSHRICELQFQNLKILTTCNTIIDKENSLFIRDDFSVSPMPSPINTTPPQPLPEHLLGISRNHLSPRGSVSLSPRGSISMSPRGSISSNCESPLPRSPLSPSPDPNYLNILSSGSRKNSSSEELGEVGQGPDIESETISDKEESRRESLGNEDESGQDLLRFSPDSTNFQLLFSTTNRTPSNQSLNKLLFPDEDLLPSTPNHSYEPDQNQEACGVQVPLPFPSDMNPPQPLSTETETAQTTEEINAVIRENIAILQRLKLKPAYGDENETTLDYFEYDDSSDSAEASEPDRSSRNYSRQNSAGSLRSWNRSGSGSRASPCRNPKVNSKSSSCDGKGAGGGSKPKKHFNPFPTSRRARVKTTRFGLYS
jgi:hypothetical protein